MADATTTAGSDVAVFTVTPESLDFGSVAAQSEAILEVTLSSDRAVGDAIDFVNLDGSLVAPAHVVHIAPDVDPLSELVLAEGSLVSTNVAALLPGSAGYVTPNGKKP